MKKPLYLTAIIALLSVSFLVSAQGGPETYSIQKFGVLPGNSPEVNRDNLQKAIDWASGE